MAAHLGESAGSDLAEGLVLRTYGVRPEVLPGFPDAEGEGGEALAVLRVARRRAAHESTARDRASWHADVPSLALLCRCARSRWRLSRSRLPATSHRTCMQSRPFVSSAIYFLLAAEVFARTRRCCTAGEWVNPDSDRTNGEHTDNNAAGCTTETESSSDVPRARVWPATEPFAPASIVVTLVRGALSPHLRTALSDSTQIYRHRCLVQLCCTFEINGT